jgi:hypothetical protein
MSSDSPPSGSTGNEGREEQVDEPPSREPSPGQPDARPPFQRCNVLILSFLSFVLIVFGVWVISAGRRYREEYAQTMEGWRVGSTRAVEITLVKDDKRNLSCASDQVIAGLQCGYRGESHEAGPLSPDSPQILRPYNTVGNDLFLGAGLWNSPDLKEPLPERRFTVVCNYHIEGVVKSAMIRFTPAASFGPVGRTVTVGTLTDCMIPR